jgi:anti-sigma regulatory factor (Ser/Thr protein kinase)
MIKLTVDATIDSLDIILEKLEEMLDDREFSPKSMMQMHVAIEELFVNIAHYAYPEDAPGKADIDMDIDSDNVVTMVFRDSGQPYNPLAKEDPDVTLSAEERDIGGLGIFMAKKSLDSMEYEYINNQNVLTIKKKFV